jgi:hypothetical protein
MRTAKNKPAKTPAPPGAKQDNIRVVSVYTGTKTASEAFHSAAVKKILYDKAKVS